MTFQSIWTTLVSPGELLFQNPECAREEVWLNVLFLQQGPIIKSEGVLKDVFSSPADLGVMICA